MKQTLREKIIPHENGIEIDGETWYFTDHDSIYHFEKLAVALVSLFEKTYEERVRKSKPKPAEFSSTTKDYDYDRGYTNGFNNCRFEFEQALLERK